MPVQNITLPVWGKSSVPIRIVQGEAESRVVQATLTDADGKPVDLTGADARLYVKKPDSTVVFWNGTVVDASGGVCKFQLPAGVAAAPGIAYGQTLITWPDGRSLKAEGLVFEIRPSDLEKAAEASNDFSALTAALSTVRLSSGTAEQAASDAQKAMADARQILGGMQTAVAASNAAAAAANSAAASAENLYRMVDPLTGQTANVTDVIDGLTAYIFRGAISAQAMDDLNREAQDFDAPDVPAGDFDTGAKTILGVL